MKQGDLKKPPCFVFELEKSFLALGLLDLGLLTTQTSEVVDARLADRTQLVDFDVLNHRRSDGEASLNTDVVGNLADGECASLTLATTLNDNTLESLQTFLLTFNDLVGHGDGITCSELRKIFYNDLIFNELN